MTITGAVDGINAYNYGDGALSITTTGTTTGTSGDGIYAYNDGNGGLTINAATTTGGNDGIDAYNNGSGALSITTTGTTTGTSDDGIDAFNGYILGPSMARLSRLTQPPRRAGTMAFMLITMAPAH